MALGRRFIREFHMPGRMPNSIAFLAGVHQTFINLCHNLSIFRPIALATLIGEHFRDARIQR